MQITNQLGLLQISPTDTAVYLTQPTAAVPGSPTHWYPDHKNFGLTFTRMVPNTAKEARAIVVEMKTLQLTKLYVSSDSSSYGKSIALEIRQDAPSGGLSIVSSAADADAVFYAGAPDQAATKAIDAAAAASPTAKLFVPSAFYDDAWVAGLSAAAQKRLYVSSPGFCPAPTRAPAPRSCRPSGRRTAIGRSRRPCSATRRCRRCSPGSSRPAPTPTAAPT